MLQGRAVERGKSLAFRATLGCLSSGSILSAALSPLPRRGENFDQLARDYLNSPVVAEASGKDRRSVQKEEHDDGKLTENWAHRVTKKWRQSGRRERETERVRRVAERQSKG